MQIKRKILISGLCILMVAGLGKLINKKPLADLDGDGPESVESEGGQQSRNDYWLSRLANPETGIIPPGIREKELAYAEKMPKRDTYFNGRTESTWSVRGPINVGAKTRALGIDISDEKVIIAGNTSGGMWKSSDSGATWARMNANINASCLAQDIRAGKTQNWYCGTGELFTGSNGSYFIGNGVWKSADGGNSWTHLSFFSSANPDFDQVYDVIWNVATDSSNHTKDVVYAAAYGTIYKSLNGGTNWSVIKGGTSPFSVYTDVAVTPKGVVYATLSSESSSKGIYRSTDGITWTNITPSNFPSTYKRIVIGISPSAEDSVYFLAETPNAGHSNTTLVNSVEWVSLWKYSYLSGDGSGVGGQWEDRSANIPSVGNNTDKYWCQGSYDMVLKVKPDNPNVIFLGGTNMYRSDDAFKTSANTTRMGGYGLGSGPPNYDPYPGHHSDQHALVFSWSNPNVIINGCDGGIYKSYNSLSSNVSWKGLNNGYITTQFYTTAIEHSTAGDNTVIAGAQDWGTWFTGNANLSSSWTHSHGGDGSYCAIADGKTNYYFSIQNSKIVKATVDANGVKTAYRRIDPIGGHGYQFVNPFVLDPNNNNVMYLAGGKYLWRNHDLSQIALTGGNDSISTNWDLLSQTDSFPAAITSLAICKSPANRLYVGTAARELYRIDNANTINSTATKIKITGSAFPANGTSNVYISSIAVDPRDGDKLIAVISNYGKRGLFYSANGGTSWTIVSGNLQKTGFYPAALTASILPVGNDTVYLVGTTTGLYSAYHLRGDSTKWSQEGFSVIGNYPVTMIDTRTSDGTVVVSTFGAGVFSGQITSVPASVKGIGKLSVNLNVFPNPSSSYFDVSFTLEQAEKVSLTLVDINGKEIKRIEEGNLPLGNHTYRVPNNFPAGIYFCMLKAGNKTETKRIVSLR